MNSILVQSLAGATPAPALATVQVLGRRLSQEQQAGAQIQVVVEGPASSAQDIAAALQNSVDSGDFQNALREQGLPLLPHKNTFCVNCRPIARMHEWKLIPSVGLAYFQNFVQVLHAVYIIVIICCRIGCVSCQFGGSSSSLTTCSSTHTCGKALYPRNN